MRVYISNSPLQGRYQFIQFLDSAVFSSALFCVDLADDRDVCLKVHFLLCFHIQMQTFLVPLL